MCNKCITVQDILDMFLDEDAFKETCMNYVGPAKDRAWCYHGYIQGMKCPRCDGTGKVYSTYKLRQLKALKELLDNLPEVVEE